MKGAGGTEGGVAPFFVGLAMAVGGAYLLTQRVTVTSGFWSFFGGHTFGLSLLPLVVGAGALFYDGKSRIGWILTAGGALIVLLGILLNLRIYFEPTTLFDTLLMLILLAGGLGLIARSLKPHGVAYVSCCPLAWIFTQVSFRVRVRLKTGRPGFESGSAQK